MFKHAIIVIIAQWTITLQQLLNKTVNNRLTERRSGHACIQSMFSDVGAVELTQGAVQCLCTIPPVLAGFSAALQSLFQSDHPFLHFCFAVCSQEVAVAVLHLQFEAITTHLWALKGEQLFHFMYLEFFVLPSFPRENTNHDKKYSKFCKEEVCLYHLAHFGH